MVSCQSTFWNRSRLSAIFIFRLSLAILDMESVQCSSCQQRFDDITLLSLHHEYESCASASTASWRGEFSCPLCDQTFDQPEVLQIHFEQVHDSPTAQTTASDSLYAQDLARRERMKNDHEQQRLAESAVFNEDSLEDDDTRIARMLQDEEDAQSFAEFQVENDLCEEGLFWEEFLRRIGMVAVREPSASAHNGILTKYTRRSSSHKGSTKSTRET